MDWDLFLEDHREDNEGLYQCITDYIWFSEDNVVPSKKVYCFPNNKTWISKDIKALLNKKRRAFMAGDREEDRSVQKELRMDKNSYRKKLEGKLQ